MKKICSGPLRDEGEKWFTELSDKGTYKQFFQVTKNIICMVYLSNNDECNMTLTM